MVLGSRKQKHGMADAVTGYGAKEKRRRRVRSPLLLAPTRHPPGDVRCQALCWQEGLHLAPLLPAWF